MRAAAELCIAIATLDRPLGLTRFFDALLAGDCLPAEVVVVDQGSDDRAQAVVKRYATGSLPVTYLRQARRGLSASRNAAITASSRPIIAFSDDDCVPDHHWVAASEGAFNRAPFPDAVCGRVLPLGPALPGTYAISLRENARRADYFGRQVPWLVGTGANLIVRRAWLDRAGTFNERLGAGSLGQAAEDADLIYRLLCSGARLRYEPQMLIYHERQNKAAVLSKSRCYGYGIGAMCGLWLRRGDGYAVYLLGNRLTSLGRELAGHALNRNWTEVYRRWLGARGTLRGLAYGLTTGRNDAKLH